MDDKNIDSEQPAYPGPTNGGTCGQYVPPLVSQGWSLALVRLFALLIILTGRNQPEGIRLKASLSMSSLLAALMIINAIILRALI